MKRPIVLTGLAVALLLTAAPASAYDRYGERPPVVVSPDLSAPWLRQLGRDDGPRYQRRELRRVERRERRELRRESRRQAVDEDLQWQRPWEGRRVERRAANPGVVISGAGYRNATFRPQAVRPRFDPKYLPQTVAYYGAEKPGTIVIDTVENFLYLVGANGEARRYGVGTGKPGFEWAGTHKVTRKAEWPDWRPPAEMIARERAKGRDLPVHMAGGPDNPLGARALYLGSTLYRIHGTNQPETIGGAVSSGCIRMRNEDVMDLYERVAIGTRVVVR